MRGRRRRVSFAGMTIDPVVLEGGLVRLVPLEAAHAASLWRVADDLDLWHLTTVRMESEGDVRRYVAEALAARAAGTAMPFATVHAPTGRLIGSTRFFNWEPAHRRVEIGYTWVARQWQRTPVNTQAKYLMLRHGFEALGCNRVELKTDALNHRSQNAMLRIGATREGTLRRHMITESGRVRDTVYFSVIREEWPAVKARLEEMLARPYTQPSAE